MAKADELLSDEILWAESAAGGDVTDPSSKRAGGYLDAEPFPNNEANFIFRAQGRWGDHFRRSASRWSTLQEAAAFLEDGETCITHQPTANGGDYAPSSFSSIFWVDTNGRDIFIGGEIASVSPGIVGLVEGIGVVTYVLPGGAANPKKVMGNDTHVAAIAANSLYVWELDGTYIDTYAHGAVLHDMTMGSSSSGESAIIIGGGRGTGNNHMRIIRASTVASEDDEDFGDDDIIVKGLCHLQSANFIAVSLECDANATANLRTYDASLSSGFSAVASRNDNTGFTSDAPPRCIEFDGELLHYIGDHDAGGRFLTTVAIGADLDPIRLIAQDEVDGSTDRLVVGGGPGMALCDGHLWKPVGSGAGALPGGYARIRCPTIPLAFDGQWFYGSSGVRTPPPFPVARIWSRFSPGGTILVGRRQRQWMHTL